MNKLMVKTLLLLLVAGLAVGGCFKGEEDTCEYWTDRLEKSPAIDRSLQKVAQLQCTEALPLLKQLYEERQHQEAVLRTVKEIGDRQGAVEILRMALRSAQHVRLAASIVGDWRLREMREDLIRILTSADLAQIREPALEALLTFEEATAIEETLIALAAFDPNIQGPEVNARAIQELGRIRSAAAVPTIVQMAYMRTSRGREVYRDARRALSRIGTGVRAALGAVVQGEAPELREYTRSIGVQDWETRYGVKTVQLLGDTLEAEAAPLLAQNMADDLSPPLGVSDKALQQWQVGQRNRLLMAVFALGHIGNEEVVEPIAAILRDRTKDTVNQRMNAATALAMIGTTAAQEALAATWREEKVDALRRPILQTLALALDNEQLGKLEREIRQHEQAIAERRDAFRTAVNELEVQLEAAEDDARAPLQRQLAIARADMDAFQLTLDKLDAYLWKGVRECRDSEACYLQKLADGTQDEKVKALVILARGRLGDRAEVVDAAIKAFVDAPKDEVDTKRFALIAVTRLGDAAAGRRLLELEETLEEDDVYWRDELHVLGNALSRR